jgi:hypothetical protein
MKIPRQGGVTLTHQRLADGAGCRLQVIWEIPEELRRSELGSIRKHVAPHVEACQAVEPGRGDRRA